MVAKTIDENFICPLSKLIMADPVVAADGETYEREKLEEWLKDNNTSPVTKGELEHKTVNPTLKQQHAIQKYLEEHPELYDNDQVYLPKAWIKEFTDAITIKNLAAVEKALARDRRLLTLKINLEVATGDLPVPTTTTPLEVVAPGGSPVPAPIPAPVTAPVLPPISPLELACKESTPEIVDFLINKLAEKNLINEKTALGLKTTILNQLLEKYLYLKDYVKCELLIKLGADVEQPDAQKNTLLHRAMGNANSFESASWLLEHKADLESRNQSNMTPLMTAVTGRSIPLVKLLLEKNANKEAKNLTNSTPLYLAVLSQQVPLVDALLSYNADPTALNHSKESVLHAATSLPMLECLLKTKAKTLIDAQDSAGNTPLHRAASAGYEKNVALLLQSGADRKIENNAGQTPLAIASNKPNIVKIIKNTVREIKKDKAAEIDKAHQTIAAQNSRIARLEQRLAKVQRDKAKQQKSLTSLWKQVTHQQSSETPKGLLVSKSVFAKSKSTAKPKEESPQEKPTSMFSFT